MEKSKLFIGSARETIKYVNALHRLLGYHAEVTPWHAGTFEANHSTMESLERRLHATDFAVFVFSPDDVVHMRDKVYLSPRDNTLFEMGLFWGKLRRDRVFYLVPERVPSHRHNIEIDQFHIPSDLQGLTVLTYEIRTDGNYTAAVNVACDEIVGRIEKLGAFADPALELERARAELDRKQSLLHFFIELHKKGRVEGEVPYNGLYEALRNAYNPAALTGYKVTGAAVWKAEGSAGIRQVAGNVGRGRYYAFDEEPRSDGASRIFVVNAYISGKTQFCLYGQHVVKVYLLCYPIGRELVVTVHLSGTRTIAQDDLIRLQEDNQELMDTIHYLFGGDTDEQA
ncbi:TIR domain-containing protein [Paenibacillus puerhi]|uniref:TIR domain-containing protein n=1 Tax=Paenibacillus puerhi TaxID=2692622 RepID=UPI001F3C3B84|nr:nucleotide-binding protein [Paenibacillus puerhi]